MAVGSHSGRAGMQRIWTNFRHVRPSIKEPCRTLKALPKRLAVIRGSKDIYYPYISLTYPEELGCLTQATNCNSVTLDSRSWSSSGLPWALVWLKPSGRPLCDRLPALLRRFVSKSSGTAQ